MSTSVDFTVFKGSKGGKIVKSKTHRELKNDDVLVKVTHSGLCFTDIHYREQDMVLGHEGVGVVESVGPDCNDLKPGDRVGWGYVQDTCGTCNMCFQGEDMYCRKAILYGVGNLDIGSFASHAVVREPFLLRVPDEIDLLNAGPLFCGGATVFEALNRYGVKPTDRVGVIGIGGLGHLAIQFAAKMGCEVVVFSGTDSKKDEAVKLGATEFHATKGLTSLGDIEPINCLLATSSAQPDWQMYLDIMAPKGIVFPLTVDMGKFENFPAFPVNNKGLTVQGSAVGPRILYRNMLAFAARHGVKPVVQTFPMTEEGIKEAVKTLLEGKMRYRGVLVAQDA
ncbi:chaperonin 10-like protein [Schizophyllum amplum]|uniref:Chaperonin 10-like protein n=1 Tax=Schizophyllum amplum TaxID=97359 RepID=A0A550CJG1_9AGAR|nr:chaperonin 10-like protein [Auriculariopsis ampla]